MKKRILIVLAALTMLLCVPLIANAASVDDLEFDPTTGTIMYCNTKAEGELVIPEEINGVKVTSIGYSAFSNCASLTSVTIPDSVTSIDGRVFYGCTSLTSITIPESVTSIGDSAFVVCESLTSITIPNGVTSIGVYAFGCCSSLQSITIPDSVTSIGNNAFYGCGSLNINVSPDNQNYCDIDGVLFTKDKKTIMAYAKDKLQPEYVIPNGVTSIGDYAFGYCSSLQSITIPGSVTSIGNYAFRYCTSLTNIVIPGSVINIGDNAFYGCENLTNITISNGVTSIGYCAFDSCTSLKNISIPDSVTSISGSAFAGCGSLNINVVPDNQNYCDIDGVLFTKDKKTIVAYAKDKLQPEYVIPNGVTSIGNEAFYYCESLTNISIPDSVTSICEAAFVGCESLTSITIPNGVTSIGNWAFFSCTSLTSITIPNGVTSIGDWAFAGCESLTDVYYSGTEREWKRIEIGERNDELLNANIHFLGNPLEVQPVEPETDTGANKITIPVTVTDAERAAELNNVRLYIAEYDADGRLTNVTFGEKGAVEGDTITFTADIPDAENYKFMLWDANNAPLMDAVDDIYAYTE